jgi:uncharacterized protein YjiK
MHTLRILLGKAARRLSAGTWIALALLATSAGYAAANHLFERLYFSVATRWHEEEWRGRSLWLPDYRVSHEAVVVEGVDNNLSGLAYDPGRDRLWAVTNAPVTLLLLSKEGAVEARYPLEGFHDVEAISYLGGDLLLSEERRETLVLMPVPTTTGSLHRDDHTVLVIGPGSDENKGFEGAAYDVIGDRLFIVKERDPMRLIEYGGLRQGLLLGPAPTVRDLSHWIDDSVFASDLSSLEFDRHTGHLVLLSDESKLLMELCRDGQLISFSSLTADSIGLRRDIPQAEGVALDGDGNLYLVSEPNLFYRFDRP